MLTSGQSINNYINDRFDKDKREVFIYLERKADTTNRDTLNYNYYVFGNPTDKLQCLGELIERISAEMGLSFDDTVEVMKNVHLQDRTIMRSRFKNRIDSEWSVLE